MDDNDGADQRVPGPAAESGATPAVYSTLFLRIGRPTQVAVLALVALIIAAVVSLLVIPDGSAPSKARGAADRPSPLQTSSAPGQTGSDSAGHVPPGSATVAGVLPWIKRVIPRDARIVADSTVGSALTADGFSFVAEPDSSTPTRIEDADYLIGTQKIRATASTDAVVQRAWDWSVPVAMFGSRADRVVVRKISPVRPRVLAARRTADARARIEAERQLLANRAVHAEGAAADALRRGELDLRSATVLVIVANSDTLDLQQVIADPAETAAGLPAHEVVVRTDPSTGVRSVLKTLPRAYRPTRIQELTGGATRITWDIDPDTFAADSP